MILRSLFKVTRLQHISEPRRNISILNSLESSQVIVSANKDIYTNLALEHWLFSNLKFVDTTNPKSDPQDTAKTFTKPIVLIWTDEPAIVIGRHQNPWIESTLGFINRAGVKLARRHSGGGCVYHDENNINISIIGHKRTFENRQENLKFLAKFLDENYGVKAKPTERHDLVHADTGYKITGSAAKLGRFNCYHHFTLLVNTDKEALSTSIRQEQQNFIKTNSSLSNRSKVINLKEIKPNLETDQIVSDLAYAYGNLLNDPESKKATKKDRTEGNQDDMDSLVKIKRELESWDWLYGMTPRFRLERTIPVFDNGSIRHIKLNVVVSKGLFESLEVDGEFTSRNPGETLQCLVGTKFTYQDAMVSAAKLLQPNITQEDEQLPSIGSDTVIITHLLQMIHDSNF